METSEEYYSRTWEEASKAYKELGFYEWCVKQITAGTYILEIGTGIGIAMLDLLEAGFIVSSLEENVYNFEKSKERLLRNGQSLNILPSIKEARKTLGQNNLIRSNFITEWQDVLNEIKYDTVVCWFVGVHPLAHQDPNLIQLGYHERDFGRYRELMYIRIFQAISLRLPVGGVISLIERIGTLTEDELSHELKWFSNTYELENYGLKLEKIEQLPIGDISLIPGIKMTPVKEGGSEVTDEERSQVTITSYTIIRIIEADLAEHVVDGNT